MPSRNNQSAMTTTEKESKSMSKDPICGMNVDETSALRAERDGQTFYFCSEHCRKKFLAQRQPAKTMPLTPVSAGADSHHDHSHHGHGRAVVIPSAAAKYFCPMCPAWSRTRQAIARNAAWPWNGMRHGSRLRRANPFTPARCTRKFSRIIPAIAPSAA